VLVYENLMSPLGARWEYVATYLEMASVFVTADAALREQAREIAQRGLQVYSVSLPATL